MEAASPSSLRCRLSAAYSRFNRPCGSHVVTPPDPRPAARSTCGCSLHVWSPDPGPVARSRSGRPPQVRSPAPGRFVCADSGRKLAVRSPMTLVGIRRGPTRPGGEPGRRRTPWAPRQRRPPTLRMPTSDITKKDRIPLARSGHTKAGSMRQRPGRRRPTPTKVASDEGRRRRRSQATKTDADEGRKRRRPTPTKVASDQGRRRRRPTPTTAGGDGGRGLRAAPVYGVGRTIRPHPGSPTTPSTASHT